MKKKLVAALVAVLAVGTFGASTASALSNTQAGDTVTVSQGEVVDASFYAAGETIIVEGTVRGDVYCAGGSIEINGTVEGDVICAGQEIRIDGVVNGNIRAAGQNIIVGASIERSVTLAGQSITLLDNSHIGQDATVMGQIMRFEGTIDRDVMANSERATFLGDVGRNADVTALDVTARDGAMIEGDLHYTSEETANISNGATVNGEVVQHQPPAAPAEEVPTTWAWLAGVLFTVALLLPVGVVLLLLLPRKVEETSTFMQKKPWITIGLGLLGVIVTPFVAVIVMITVIGLPLGLIALTMWGLSLLFGFILAAQSFGDWIFRMFKWQFNGQVFIALLLGLILLVLLSSIPLIGWLIALVAIACGFGGKLVTISKLVADQYSHKKPSKKA